MFFISHNRNLTTFPGVFPNLVRLGSEEQGHSAKVAQYRNFGAHITIFMP